MGKATTTVPAAPRAGRRPAQAAAALAPGVAPDPSGYDAAQAMRRLAAFRPTGQHVNQLLAAQGPELVRRSRELVRNNPYVRKARGSFVGNAVGTGIMPSSLVADPARRQQIQALWAEWTDEADADQLTDFYGLQALAAGAMFEAGECFVRFRPRLPQDGLSVPLQLQLIEAEQLPLAKTEALPGGTAIRSGIEFDRIGRRLAYWFHRQHPGDPLPGGFSGEMVRVPAEEVVHLYQPMRPGQIRGEPWLTAAIVKARQLEEYDEAELDRKKVAALFAGFVTKPAGQQGGGPFAGAAQNQGDGTATLNLQPGTMIELMLGEDVKFAEPADVGGSYEAFQYRVLLAVSAAMGLPYTSVTGDLRQVNYSSIRAGLVEFRRQLEQFQWATLVFQLCRPTWRRWLKAAVLALELELPGFAANPRPWYRVKWITPKWEWVDPLKDRQAELLAVRAGFKSRSDVVEAEGHDAAEVDARVAADNARSDELGLVYDSDPRRVTSAGVGQFVDPDPKDVGPGQPTPAGGAGTAAASALARRLDAFEIRMAEIGRRASARRAASDTA